MNYIKILKFPFILFLVAYFLYAIVANVPAAWAARIAHGAVPNLWFSGVQGTIWSGEAKAAQVDIESRPVALGKVTWQLSALSLLTFKPCIDFEAIANAQMISGNVCYGGGQSVSMTDLSIDAPLSVAKNLLPLQATGLISLQIKEADVNSDGTIVNLQGQVSWQNANVNTGDMWLQLGSFGGNISHNELGGITVKAFDIEGPYKADLTCDWVMGKPWAVRGLVKPKEGAADVVKQGLQMLGEDAGGGAYKVQWPL